MTEILKADKSVVPHNEDIIYIIHQTIKKTFNVIDRPGQGLLNPSSLQLFWHRVKI